MAALSLRNVIKRYGHGPKANQVIHGVSAEIADHEFIVIVGPSGCGKSTLLRMVAGLEEISGGEISIGGRVVNNLEPAERDIAMVFQNYALYPHMTVYGNMAYGLKIAKVPEAEIKARVDKAAKILELGPFLGAAFILFRVWLGLSVLLAGRRGLAVGESLPLFSWRRQLLLPTRKARGTEYRSHLQSCRAATGHIRAVREAPACDH